MHRRIVLPLIAAILAGCATTAPAQPRRTEAVYAAVAGKEALRVRFSSNGCTKKEDFAIVRRGGAVTFRRVTPDMCKSFAIGSVWIEFSYAELGVGRGDFTLGNPLTRWNGPGD